ncbi:MAG: dephospho-CoA kinase [Clostridiales bacterium]|jgi:dephospho-CoA kinase|nr:dephospho-CoA kinase [Clostridiales bacterium]
MIKIGLTGGIGAGKSTVSEYLRNRGYIVLDADAIGRDLTKKGGEAIPFITEHFGDDMIKADGNLNRKKLADIVYNDKEKLALYESATTLKIVETILSDMSWYEDCDTLIFAEVPLLFEKNMNKEMDFNWVVVSDDEDRIKRVIDRDKISEKLIKDIIKNQMDQDVKMKLSDEVIDNSSDAKFLYEQIDKLLEKYQQKV